MTPKKSLFDQLTYDECKQRIEQLTNDSQPIWGKMDVAQMLAHCSEVQEVFNGKELKNTPFIVKLFKGYIKKMITNEVPYKKGEKTHPQYIVADQRTFDKEKKCLLDALRSLYENPGPKHHTLFGQIDQDDAGWAVYKHLNHHLSQFGV